MSASNDQLRANLHRELVESGKRDQYDIRPRCQGMDISHLERRTTKPRDLYILRSKEKIPSVDDLIVQVNPHARATVPDRVKAELLRDISAFIEDAL
ncbi:hypothetical protein DFQ27_001044 [Actinomortierella ambigua]|uniref:Uncharacterized protein n=1 Tax=Actinomortierella ambigua TaxID=1343610 RepID=A0A9P6QDH0_9FUNG|nr:hypothetical protein DFQ27_001044 [Actinomortierella ambigua]